MARTNREATIPNPKTHEGAVAYRVNAEAQLRRSLMACLLWEDTFYEDGQSIAERLANEVLTTKPEVAAKLAVEAREQMKLRHAPLWVARALASGTAAQRAVVANLLATIIQRPDELTEFLSLYWLQKRQPLSAQVKKGLARAFGKFDAYRLAKYNRDDAVKLRDVLFLCHARPKDEEQAAVWKQLVDGTLPTPDTWEVALSAGTDKKVTWERLLSEQKLGALALLRNLRNMEQAKVSKATIRAALTSMNTERVLPFRFVAAALAAPEFEDAIDSAFIGMLQQQPKLAGRTVVILDVSGSMYGSTVSAKSDMDRAYAAAALGAIARELCEDSAIYATAGNDYSRIHKTAKVPTRHGMALVEAIYKMCHPLGGGGIFLNQVCNFVRENEGEADRTIVITDEQDCSNGSEDAPSKARPLGRGYLINVNSYRNGIGYKPHWTHIDGWSENVVRYITELERQIQ